MYLIEARLPAVVVPTAPASMRWPSVAGDTTFLRSSRAGAGAAAAAAAAQRLAGLAVADVPYEPPATVRGPSSWRAGGLAGWLAGWLAGGPRTHDVPPCQRSRSVCRLCLRLCLRLGAVGWGWGCRRW
jgi:hypothetical protein